MRDLTQKRLKELLHYDPDTGHFTCIKKRQNASVGGRAGGNHHYGYIRIGIDNEKYQAHRLAFLFMGGKFPENQVDHINGVRDDNRWRNLREATAHENMRNSCIQKNNKSGIKGVSWSKTNKSWRAVIYKNGRQIHIGHFHKKEDAGKAYRDSADEHYKEFAKYA